MKRILNLIWIFFLFPFWLTGGLIAASEYSQQGEAHLGKKLKIALNLNYNKPVIAGSQAIYGLMAKDENNLPLKGASIRFTATGGVFENTSASSCRGLTKENGWFHSRWQAPNQVGSYQITWHVSYPGYDPKEGIIQVEVEPITGEVHKKFKIVLNQNLNKPVYANETAIYSILITGENNRPIKGTNVKFTASGGAFEQTAGLFNQGRTNEKGRFKSLWKAPDVAGSYQITWRATFPGYDTKKGIIHIEVKSKPKKIRKKLKIGINNNHNNPVIAGRKAIYGLMVTNENNRPLKGTSVRFNASGGQFEDTNSSTCRGKTKNNGWFNARWKIPGHTGSYQITWRVTYPGYTPEEGVINIDVEPNPRKLKATYDVQPSTVNHNGKSTISFFIYEEKDGIRQAVGNATVQLNASNGFFDITQEEEISGETNHLGLFARDWRAPQNGRSSTITATISKEGYPHPMEQTMTVTLTERTPETGNLRIRLKEESGALLRSCPPPLKIAVTARHNASNTIYDGRIDQNCQCRFANLPSGQYSLQLSEMDDFHGELFNQGIQVSAYLQANKTNTVIVPWEDRD